LNILKTQWSFINRILDNQVNFTSFLDRNVSWDVDCKLSGISNISCRSVVCIVAIRIGGSRGLRLRRNLVSQWSTYIVYELLEWVLEGERGLSVLYKNLEPMRTMNQKQETHPLNVEVPCVNAQLADVIFWL